MRSRLAPRRYTDPASFALEAERLFGRLWQFFTLGALVAREHAFVTRRLAGRSIVLQRFGDELRAFDNVCLHRHAPLQHEPEGTRPLVCPYHAWRYDASGAPTIPFCDELYRFPPEERAALRLRAYPVAVVGGLVFINLAADPLPLEAQFSPQFLASLRACSSVFDDEVILTTFRRRFDWKLAYENLRDAHHPRFLHAHTLAPAFPFSPVMDEAAIAEARAIHAGRAPLDRAAALALLRRLSWGGLDAPPTSFQPLPWHGEVDRFGTDEGYLNWLAFPNLHVASPSGGRSFTIEHHLPVGPGLTDVVVHFVTARKRRPYPTSAAVLWAHMTAAQRVLAEDFSMLERVQGALAGRPDEARAALGDYEGTSLLVERFYDGLLEGEFAV